MAKDMHQDEQVMQRMAESKNQEPIVMVNLVKVDPAGQADFEQYVAKVFPMIERWGGSLLYAGAVAGILNGEGDWDQVVLVKYPSRNAFVDMVHSEEYGAIHPYRERGLERTELYLTDPAEAV
jgi:uncharacterized protein (DUF1330 family)